MYQLSTISHKSLQFPASPEIPRNPLTPARKSAIIGYTGREKSRLSFQLNFRPVFRLDFVMKACTYPSHTQGKSNAGKAPKTVSSRHQWIDWICEALVIGGCIGSMVGLVTYANHRDQQYFRTQYISSFPSRPEECQPQDNCKPHYNPQHNS